MNEKKMGPQGTGYLWDRVFRLIKLLTGDVAVKEKGNLQKQIDDMGVRVEDCFQSVSNGKRKVADAITDKGVSTAADATFATMEANIRAIKTNPKLQAKTAALSTAAQTVKPDSGYDGLSQVVVPAVKGTAAAGDVLSGKTFNSAAGIDQTGTLADKTVSADYSAAASLDAANSRLKMKIPSAGKYGTGNYLYAAYSAIASLIGLTASKLVKGNTVLGVAGDSNNMNTGSCDATAAQLLTGKKAGVKGAVVTGSMTNKAATTVDAALVTQDDEYTYLGIPADGFYDKNSKVRALNRDLNSNLCNEYTIIDTISYGSDPTVSNKKYILGNRGYKTALLIINGLSSNSNTLLTNISITCDNVKITELNTPYNGYSALNKCLIYELKNISDDDYIQITTYCRTVSIQFIGIS